MATARHKMAHSVREVLTLNTVCDKLLPAQSLVPWCSGLTCGPVKAEIAGSNPVGAAEIHIDHKESRNEDTHSGSLLFLSYKSLQFIKEVTTPHASMRGLPGHSPEISSPSLKILWDAFSSRSMMRPHTGH